MAIDYTHPKRTAKITLTADNPVTVIRPSCDFLSTAPDAETWAAHLQWCAMVHDRT